MLKLRRVLLPFLVAASGEVLAQRPVIQPNGVVNAASHDRSVTGEALLVGGAIFSIFGENLAASEEKASGTPLPTMLGGTSVTVGEIAAPLFYVSPGRINFQVPYAVGPIWNGKSFSGGRVGNRFPVVVTTDAGASEPVLAFVQRDSAGIFTHGGGCAQGLIQNAAADGSPAWNTPANSASPGDFITVYGTGLGPPYSPPEDGQPASARPLTEFDLPGFFLGIEGFQPSPGLQPWWAGLAPGLVGVNQVTVKLGDDVLEGCAVPLQMVAHTAIGAPVTISIRRGGGPCRDAPPARFANLRWRKMITTSAESPSGLEEGTFTASFASAPENLAVPVPDPPDLPFRGCRCGLGAFYAKNPQCRGAGLTALDAGALTLEGLSGGPLILLPSLSGVTAEYSTPLPPRSMEAGTLRVVGGGGADVSGFATDVTIPPPIQVTTPLPPGTVIDVHRPFSVAWSGGDPETLVRMRLIAYWEEEGVLHETACECPVPAGAGMAKLDVFSPTGNEILLMIGRRSENAEVVLTVTPLTSKLMRFTVPGLTREGRHEWSYEYRFQGLKIR